jgi:hypothetical protein
VRGRTTGSAIVERARKRGVEAIVIGAEPPSPIRGGGLLGGVSGGRPKELGEITAYCTDIAFFAHAVAETNNGLKALIGSASAFPGGGFLVPTRNGDLFRWCLQHELRLVHQLTLMTIGLYNEPAGAYLPSVLY